MIPPVVGSLLDNLGLSVSFTKAFKAYIQLKGKSLGDLTVKDIATAADVVNLKFNVSEGVMNAVTVLIESKDINKAADSIQDPEVLAEFTEICAKLVGVLFTPVKASDNSLTIESEVHDQFNHVTPALARLVD